VEGGDEIGLLAREFNGLADHLERYRKSSLGDLLQAQQASQAAIDGLPDPVIMLDPAGLPQGCNRAAIQFLGLDLDHGGDTALSQVDTTVRASLLRMHESVRAGRGAYHPKGFEDALRVDTPEGARVYLPSATPIRGESGQITGTAAVFQDITRVFHFDELKSDLVSTVAHEFRTPLTSLRMAIHLCLENAVGPLTEKQTDLLTAGREDCERLQGMVDDLLDLSRLESGRIELHRRSIEPNDLLTMAVEAHHAAAEVAGVALRVECLPGLPELFVDVDRLQLVFANLVTNAIRYSPKGGEIVLGAQTVDGSLRFDVTDQGQGIAPEYRVAVFEKFFRVPGSPSGGAGLGLFIARGIVVSHGGEIGATDRDGQGTTFWFMLPVEARRPGGPGSATR
jgi:signal transduction histidine kinase